MTLTAIGVAARATELETVIEFFELFKIPWELARPGRRYRVILSTSGCPPDLDGDLWLVYGSSEHPFDRGDARTPLGQAHGMLDVEWDGTVFPLYGRVSLFLRGASTTVTHGGRALDYRSQDGRRRLWRLGYDLFDEVRHLLIVGQPAVRSASPTLDLHIALLRHVLEESGVVFVEVPPRPAGHDFVCCLTHDLDFFGIRRHAFDATLAGFLARASIGTCVDLVKGKRSLADAARNWKAVLSLPFVHMGILPDFWKPLAQYEKADRGHRSTYFVLPFKNRPGIAPDGRVEARRAVRYQAREIAEELRAAAALGHELGLHGIDAWRDDDAGRAELAEVTSVTGRSTAGVRMHWLYFDAGSPSRLEAAGFEYDSTYGYNDAVGYRAGTAQPFRLPGTKSLLELPLTIMDSALFYSGRLGLNRAVALDCCRRIVAHARRAGGAVVVNWHDRSLAPERLWGPAYDELLDEVESGRPWFATASQAIEWFRWRRSIGFTCHPDGALTVAAGMLQPGLPGARVAVHGPAPAGREERTLIGDGVLRVPS